MRFDWKPIPRHEHYQANSEGLVRNQTGKILKPANNGNGYLWYMLMPGRQIWYAHRLVAELFLDAPSEGQREVSHQNHKRNDNRKENLRWASHAENVQHSWKAGRMEHLPIFYNIRPANAKVDPTLACHIRRRIKSGERREDLSLEFNLSKSTVQRIASGHRYKRRTWADL